MQVNDGLRRARRFIQQQGAQWQRQKLFDGASEWTYGLEAARLSGAPGHQAAKGWGQINDRGGIGSL